jgi:uncharacterized protein (TIGR02646 family)
MRFVGRIPLSPEAIRGLKNRQAKVDEKVREGTLDAIKEWKSGGTLDSVKAAKRVLQAMAGETERCMYCQDSHGTDIEHFKPKTPFPESMYQWENMLLCCAECGRFKGDRFPIDADSKPLLVDPSRQNPWDYIDFDPQTGNMTARFIAATANFSKEGETTVTVLHLDRRGALSSLYKQADRRLRELTSAGVGSMEDDESLADRLLKNDDAGLLGWYIQGSGQKEEPFASLARLRPRVVNAIRSKLESPNAR